MNVHVGLDEVREVVLVLPVVGRQDDGPDSGPLGCDDFLLDSSHGKNFPPQTELPRHGQVGPDGLVRGEGQQGGHDGHPGTWAVLGGGALGHVEVEPEDLRSQSGLRNGDVDDASSFMP